MSKQISDDIKQFSYEICQKHKVTIKLRGNRQRPYTLYDRSRTNDVR